MRRLPGGSQGSSMRAGRQGACSAAATWLSWARTWCQVRPGVAAAPLPLGCTSSCTPPARGGPTWQAFSVGSFFYQPGKVHPLFCRQWAGSGGGHWRQHLHQHPGGCVEPAGRWLACSCYSTVCVPPTPACSARLPMPQHLPCPQCLLQKPPNAFELGVRRVSYLLIAFMAAMVPLVVAISGYVTGNWPQVRGRACLQAHGCTASCTAEMRAAAVGGCALAAV